MSIPQTSAASLNAMLVCKNGAPAFSTLRNVSTLVFGPLRGRSALPTDRTLVSRTVSQQRQVRSFSVPTTGARDGRYSKDSNDTRTVGLRHNAQFKPASGNRDRTPFQRRSMEAKQNARGVRARSDSHVRLGETSPKTTEAKPKENWMVQKTALNRKFGDEGWNPRKKLSPDALEGIRALNKQQPEIYTTEILAKEFEVSAEVIRRILKSKWKPSEAAVADRRQRWEKRGEKIWAARAESGDKPPKKWRQALGIKLRPRTGHGGPRLGLGPGAFPVATKAADDDLSKLPDH